VTGALTRSEHAVLCLLANGRTVTELMAELHLSRHTINSHRSSAYRKLGAHSLDEAVARAVEVGVLSLGDIVTGPRALARRAAAAEGRLAAVRVLAHRLIRSGAAGEAEVARRFLAELDEQAA
jgi:DNA-binding CsgD family transcriptional regulator